MEIRTAKLCVHIGLEAGGGNGFTRNREESVVFVSKTLVKNHPKHF